MTAGGPSATAAWLIALLTPHTPFGEAIVRRQAERIGKSLATVEPGDVARMGPLIVVAAGVFLDPPALASVNAALRTRSV